LRRLPAFNQGVPLRIDYRYAIKHDKFFIAD
jgi:hypothetical protein